MNDYNEKAVKEILAKIWRRSCMYPMVDYDKITIIECIEAMKEYHKQLQNSFVK